MYNLKMMFTLSWRNLWRSKRRTILTLLTILVGTSMIILINSFAKGGHDEMIDDAVSMNTGHIQIHEKGFWDNLTIDYAFKPNPELIELLNNDPEIKGYTERISTGGLLAYHGGSKGVMVQGTDPENEKRTSNIWSKILPGGRFFNSNDKNKIIIGAVLAKNTALKTGDEVSIISQGFDGSIAAENLEIIGIFKTGNISQDRELVLIPLELSDEMFSMMGFRHSIVINIEDISGIPAITEKIKRISHESELEVMGWDELLPELVQFIIMDDISGYIFDIILFLVVAFGVLNTIQMAVYERTREFGIMLAIGTKPGLITKLVLLETLIISAIGVFLGVLLGSLVSYYFNINPIDIAQYANEMAVWGMSTTQLPADITFMNICVTASITFICSVLFSYFPARRAAKLNPVDAIRKL